MAGMPPFRDQIRKSGAMIGNIDAAIDSAEVRQQAESPIIQPRPVDVAGGLRPVVVNLSSTARNPVDLGAGVGFLYRKDVGAAGGLLDVLLPDGTVESIKPGTVVNAPFSSLRVQQSAGSASTGQAHLLVFTRSDVQVKEFQADKAADTVYAAWETIVSINPQRVGLAIGDHWVTAAGMSGPATNPPDAGIFEFTDYEAVVFEVAMKAFTGTGTLLHQVQIAGIADATHNRHGIMDSGATGGATGRSVIFEFGANAHVDIVNAPHQAKMRAFVPRFASFKLAVATEAIPSAADADSLLRIVGRRRAGA